VSYVKHKFFFHPPKESTPMEYISIPSTEKHSLIANIKEKKLQEELDKASDFPDFWDQVKNHIVHRPPSAYMRALLDEKGLKRSDVVVRTGLDKAYVYQIFAGKRNPSRDKLILLAFGMNLNEEETQKMLELSGYRPLWPKDERDALFLFAIQRGMSLEDVHAELERYELDPLATPVK